VRGIDACWEELRRQTADGTTRAWLGLLASGVVPSGDPDPDSIVTRGVLDGCAIALSGGVAEDVVREAHDALWLAALRVLEEDV
jgi:hypothetical protein